MTRLFLMTATLAATVALAVGASAPAFAANSGGTTGSTSGYSTVPGVTSTTVCSASALRGQRNFRCIR